MQKYEPPDETTRAHIRALIQANFAGRDDLYAAVDSETLAKICRRLAEDLANNAIELQQIALGAGMSEVNISRTGAQLQAELMELLQQREGDQAVLEEAEECEQIVRREYDDAIEQTDSPAVADILRRQRETVEFGKSVVHGLRSSEEGTSGTN